MALGSIVAAPAAMAADSTIDDAVFTWGINNESNNSAFQPGAINLLSAGEIAKTSGADTVVESEWKQNDGNVAIQKKQADGTWAPSTWAGLRTTATGGPITPPSSANYSDNRVAISGGTGTVNVEAGTAEIQWDGTFTAAYYQGLTQFSASDPKLTVDADGTGVVTATLSGYGTSMDDTNVFVVLEPRQDVVVATLSGVDVTETGFTVTPDYLGRVISVSPSGNPQSTTGANAGSFPQSFVDFQVLTGMASYWYSSGGAADAAKPTTPLGVSYTVAPVVPEVVPATITKQPAGVTVEDAGKATFTVEAAGDGPLSYRWELSEDGGATWTPQSTDAPTLTLAFQTSQSGALVRVTVDNAARRPVVSESAVVRVLDPVAPIPQVAPAITAQPSDVVAPIAPATGSPVASFAVTATGSPEPTVVWERRAAGGDWVAIEGATAATLTLPYTAADDATEVRAVVSNAAGSATSEAATLTVGAPASITAQPSAASVKVGETATFTVGIAGAAAAVQWQRLAAGATGWTDVAGATGTSLEVVTTAQDAGAQYRAVVTGTIPTEIDGSVFSVTSAPVGLAVDTTIPVAAAIVSQPVSVTAPVGAASPSVFFSVGVTGTPAPSVQWFERAVGADGWSAVTGATSTTLEVVYADGDGGKRFRAVVGNGIGDPVTSDVATLTLGVPASITAQPASVSVAHGEDAVFAVATAGDDVAVQWQHLALGSTGWVDLDGATSAELTVASADVRNGEQVRATVSNDVPSAPGASGGSTVTSAAASVTLTVPGTVPAAPDAASLTEAPGIDITGIDGDVITVSVGTQHAGQYLGAYAFSEPQWLGWALVAADGTVSFTVPSDLEAGDHTLAVLDADGVLIGTAAFTVTVTVVTNPDGSTTTTTAVLASTGADAAVPFLAGGLLLAAGLVLALLARRRKTQVAAV
ncbi:hypothetical protein BWO91_14855 [Plantibacter flavus]|uniref:hypothetical protein n=1 Tax=Plantibacter flavus TaxID=150123 RepID=UPI00099D89D0|nr:hypothetical protein [Plantibacter flavus]AQX81080.1 hypothetical protein BWO91_14855 [Plantibacter flavus]